MGRFLRENWLWIALPVVLIVVLCLLIAWFSASDTVTPIQYPF